MTKFFGIAFIAITIAACNNSGSEKINEPVTSAPNLSTPVPSPLPVTTQPGSTAPATGNGALALNPAHGAPGHNCNIPVGAPLNTAAAGTAPAPAAGTPPPVMFNPQLPQQPVNSNARLNPAHGQPGHDCAIPVGQPLKS